MDRVGEGEGGGGGGSSSAGPYLGPWLEWCLKKKKLEPGSWQAHPYSCCPRALTSLNKLYPLYFQSFTRSGEPGAGWEESANAVNGHLKGQWEGNHKSN